MTHEGHRITSPKERTVQATALACLLILGGLAVVGPSGLLSWSESLRQLDQRNAQIAKLKHERDELKIAVDALNPNHADPDLASELIRRDLNVVRSDEIVLSLDGKAGHGTDTGN